MSNRTASLFLCALLLVPAVLPGQTSQTQTTVLVPRGTILELANLQPIDAATAKVGDRIPLRLTRPLVVNGVTVLAEGETLSGKVNKVHKQDPNCKSSQGWVEWSLNQVAFSDSSTVRISVVGTAIDPRRPGSGPMKYVVNEKGEFVSRLDLIEKKGVPRRAGTGQKIAMAVGFVPGMILVGPGMLAETIEAGPCGRVAPGISPILVGTTVVVAIGADHRVRL
jgi:hypothetical protein